MTYEEAAMILDPETSWVELLPCVYDPKRKQTLLQEACKKAAEVLRIFSDISATHELVNAKYELPIEYNTVFAQFKNTEKWQSGMFEKISDDVFVVVKSPEGQTCFSVGHTCDGVWKFYSNVPPDSEVIYWGKEVGTSSK